MNSGLPSYGRKEENTPVKSWIDYFSEKVHFEKHVRKLRNELHKNEKNYVNTRSHFIKEEEKEKKEVTKNLLLDFSNNTSLHGVRNITDSKNTLLRLFYIGVLGSFMVIVSYYLITLFIVYNSYPVNRKYTASLQEKMMFPAITMCDLHPYNLNNQSILISILQGIRSKNYSHPLFSLEEETIYTLIFSDENKDLESNFNSSDLCADDWIFRWMVIGDDILKCYTFNSVNKTEPRIIDKPGIKYGLGIVRNFSELYSDKTTGVRIFVHSPFKRAYEQDCSFFAGPGLSTFAIIHPLKLTLLGYPYHPIDEDCVSDEKQSFMDNASPYSQVICEEKCRVDFVIRICNCSPSFSSGNNRKCTFREIMTCELSASDEFLTNKSHLNMCNCVRSCTYTTYSISTSVAYFPKPPEDTKPSKFKIHLYYESMILKEISEQEMYTSEAFLAQFGGQMGLFLGASLITAMELVEFIIMVLWTQFRCLVNYMLTVL